jgi:GNAT superfamily N-acetyltransferase
VTRGLATEADAAAIAALRNAAAEHLTQRHGTGHWSSVATERGVLRALRTSRILVERAGERLVATLRLATKRPWAIDPAYFTAVPQALYLTDMAVAPDVQRQGVGRGLLLEAERFARDWPSQAIRLDAYDAAAGAGEFYAKCGYREMGRVIYRKTPLVYYERVW